MDCCFASDNTSGLCPEAWDALRGANTGCVKSYGDDELTARAADLFREFFDTDCDVYFVFTGTAANSLALAALCQSYHSVIAHECSHIETDECGGPEFFSNGTKLLLVGGEAGKLDPKQAESLISRRSDIHFPRPRVLSITQPTELGTVYAESELRTLGGLAQKRGLKLHMDGARFPHAVASLGITPRRMTWEAGVDVVTCGATKSGGMGEAVVFFDRAASEEFAYRCKQAGQLASKMRFLAAPWVPLLGDGKWLRYAAQANQMAKKLEARLREIRGVKILHAVQANAVFAQFPEAYHNELHARGWHYYVFIGGGARFMCSWATTEQDVERLTGDLAEIAGV